MAPEIFKHRCGGSHDQHIEENVEEIAMSEHVREKLVRPEVFCLWIPKRQQKCEIRYELLPNKYYNIDDNDVSDNRCES